jgi:hypothetical protein
MSSPSVKTKPFAESNLTSTSYSNVGGGDGPGVGGLFDSGFPAELRKLANTIPIAITMMTVTAVRTGFFSLTPVQ